MSNACIRLASVIEILYRERVSHSHVHLQFPLTKLQNDANTEQKQPSKWHQNGVPFPRTMPKIPNVEQLILRVAREVEEQHPNTLIQPWQNRSVANCQTITIGNLVLRHT